MKTPTALGLAGLVSLLGLVSSKALTGIFCVPKVTEQHSKALAEVAKQQEKAIGITHFGLPNLEYGVEAYAEARGLAGIPNATYFPHRDTIVLDNMAKDVKGIISHELGHFYPDKLSESLGNGDWPNFDSLSLCEKVRTKLIAEGIAEYFRRKTNGKPDDFNDSEWPETFKGFSERRILYAGGYHLVKPVIDRHGKRGIGFLIQNIPRSDELENLPAYQQRILEALEKN